MADLPPFLRIQGSQIILAVKLQPRASANEIGAPLGVQLKVKVTAPPVDAAANEALIRLLADVLDCPKGSVQLIRGHTSRNKMIAISGLTPAYVQVRLLSQS